MHEIRRAAFDEEGKKERTKGKSERGKTSRAKRKVTASANNYSRHVCHLWKIWTDQKVKDGQKITAHADSTAELV
jgi:hypothetical protein